MTSTHAMGLYSILGPTEVMKEEKNYSILEPVQNYLSQIVHKNNRFNEPASVSANIHMNYFLNLSVNF
jgi:hypothetical protein